MNITWGLKMRTSILSLVLFSLGCHNMDYVVEENDGRILPFHIPSSLGNENVSDRFEIRKQEEITVLFVMDNSGSMTSYQEKLIENIPGLIDPLIYSGIDFHFGVTTTDCGFDFPEENSNIADDCGKVDWMTGGADHSISGMKHIASDMLLVGNMGSPSEKGTKAAYFALNKRNDQNEGFFTSGPLHIVFVSDEPDSTDFLTQGFAQLLFEEERKNRGVFSISSIIKTTEDYISSQGEGCMALYARAYSELAFSFSGKTAEICSNDWSRPVEEIAKNFVKTQEEFYLSRLPVNETIEVSLQKDEYTVVLDHTDWVYLEKENAIQISGLSPEMAQEVVISYNVNY